MADAEWVTVTDAARRETAAGRQITKPALSRYLARHGDAPVRKDAKGRVVLVHYPALAAHRAGNIGVADKQAELAHAAPAAPAKEVSSSDRKRAAEAEKAELDLAERKGQLISRAAVLRAQSAAGVALAQAMDRLARPLAVKVTGESDLRTNELAIKTAFRDLREAFADELIAAAARELGAVTPLAREATGPAAE